MSAIYKTIIDKGLAENDQIFFVSSLGGELDPSLSNNHITNGFGFRMYGDNGGGGFTFGSNQGGFGGGGFGGGGGNFGGGGAFGAGGGNFGGGGAFGARGGKFGGGGAFGGGGGAGAGGSFVLPTLENNGMYHFY